MPLSNPEKQERFRRKEALSQKAKDIFIRWQLSRGLDLSQSPSEVKSQLEKIVALPSGWTDEDYATAERKLDFFELNTLSSNPHLLENDIWDGRKQDAEDAASVREGKEALVNAQNHTHIILSTFTLSKNRNSDNAAIIMEVARKLGASLLADACKGDIPRSDATALCLLLTNPMLPRPAWFLEAIAKILKDQIPNHDTRKNLAKMILDDTTSHFV